MRREYRTSDKEWSDAELLRLRELWDTGLSASKIGDHLERTKNSVLGKVHRLDLGARRSPIKAAQPKPPPAPKPLKPAQDVATMQRLAAEGFSGLAIAQVVGCNPKTVRKNVYIPRPHERAPAPSVISPPVVRPSMAAIEAVQQIRLALPPRVSRARTCLWPMWGHDERPTHRFCGGVSAVGSYCAEHASVAYIPFRRRAA